MKLKTVRYTIYDKKIPTELSGSRIALFSDLHDHRIGEDDELLMQALEEMRVTVIYVDAAVDAETPEESESGDLSGFDL